MHDRRAPFLPWRAVRGPPFVFQGMDASCDASMLLVDPSAHGGGVVLAVSGAAAGLSGGVADAARLGSLTMIPADGTDQTVPQVKTSAGARGPQIATTSS